ncbi:MAG: efflux RND transporter periplasmic adaptor subunit, partial [Candidatus Omnitrophica bacterium]|nr:efflux RND transporter periplasmic adaptor subunit [Candidatus Omnitrophota bacterium]
MALGLSLGMTGCAKKGADAVKGQEESKVAYWTCAMHPSVRADKPGKCPICGMDLIPVYEEKVAPKEEMAKKEEAYYGCGVKEEGHCPHCDEGKPDENCICGKHTVVIKGAQMNCPVCGRPLKKLEPEELAKIDKSIVSRVSLRQEQVKLAGLVLEPARKYHLSKTIRTVGKIAFDPELAVAQEEFITALETQEKVSKSPDVDVINRAQDIVNKSKLRLRLLGLSEAEIKELENSRKAETSLILPEDKAWVYAEIYEYDIGWVKEGEDAKVTSVAFPGEEFKGVIRSITPVL